MFKRIPLVFTLAVTSVVGLGASTSSASTSYNTADASQQECQREEEEQTRHANTNAGVAKIIKVTMCGIYWFEAQDANGNRYTITQVTSGNPSKGYVDFGDGNGGRYCEWH